MERKRVLGYILSLGTALCWSVTAVMAKWGVSKLSSPLVGASIALFAGGVILVLASRFGTPYNSSPNAKKGIIYFALCGMVAGIAVMASYYALTLLPVTVVSPISNSSPVVVLLIVFIWLRRLEKLTRTVVLGSLLVVIGGVLITLGRAH